MPVFSHLSAADSWALERAESALRAILFEIIVVVTTVGRSFRGANLQELFHLRVLSDAEWCSDQWGDGSVAFGGDNVETRCSGGSRSRARSGPIRVPILVAGNFALLIILKLWRLAGHFGE